MNGSVIQEPSRSLKEQFSRSSEAWKEQSDPIFRFWAQGDWWGFPFFSLSARRYFGEKENTLSLLASCDRRHRRSKGARFLRCVLRPSGNVSQGRWKQHQSLEPGTQWQFGRRQ
jgi:hypothetical protein